MKAKAAGKKAKTYVQLYTHELDTIQDKLSPTDAAAVLYNIALFAREELGREPEQKMVKMSPMAQGFFEMVKDRLDEQLENARFGAPAGNKNAEKPGKKEVVEKVIEMHEAGYTQETIAKEVGRSVGSVNGYIKDYYGESTKEDQIKKAELQARVAYGA